MAVTERVTPPVTTQVTAELSMIAGAAMAASSVLVVTNSLRLRSFR